MNETPAVSAADYREARAIVIDKLHQLERDPRFAKDARSISEELEKLVQTSSAYLPYLKEAYERLNGVFSNDVEDLTNLKLFLLELDKLIQILKRDLHMT